ncbi:AAA family ATPase [Aliarcobacter butzleri]|uniref:AAA family ATPase n=1 Tax=Aliarcobacter butzleri TaxID=28197 RepID=UPI003AFB5B2C
MIEEFVIKELYGNQNVSINFKNNIKIVIGENGSGKTTILNILYYILTKKYSKLLDINFNSISIKFSNNEEFLINKYHLLQFINYSKDVKNDIIFKNEIINEDLKYEYVEKLHKFLNDNYTAYIDFFLFDEIQKNEQFDGFVNNFIFEKFVNLKEEEKKISKEKINEIDTSITNNHPRTKIKKEYFYNLSFESQINILRLEKEIKELNLTILYFPTYRRIEENIKNIESLNYKNEHELINNDTLIHFGMEDVEKRINKLKQEISDKTNSGFNEISGELLSKLFNGIDEIEDKDLDEIDEKALKLVLSRIGTNLSSIDKNNILKLIQDKNELKTRKELTFYILQLIELHKKVQHLDEKIINFEKICNKYLFNKKIKYDANKLEVKVVKENFTKDKIEFSNLSSGEKQLISIFSRIYLENNENLFVIFDEPELSLSIDWQKKLLPDIVSSGKCKFLLAVTHSPFIFKNDLEIYASSLNSYISDDIPF